MLKKSKSRCVQCAWYIHTYLHLGVLLRVNACPGWIGLNVIKLSFDANSKCNANEQKENKTNERSMAKKHCRCQTSAKKELFAFHAEYIQCRRLHLLVIVQRFFFIIPLHAFAIFMTFILIVIALSIITMHVIMVPSNGGIICFEKSCSLMMMFSFYSQLSHIIFVVTARHFAFPFFCIVRQHHRNFALFLFIILNWCPVHR